MANQDKDQRAGAEDGAGDNPVKAEGAVSTGEGPGDAAAVRGPAGNEQAPGGESGIAQDDGPAARGDGPSGNGPAGGGEGAARPASPVPVTS